MITAVTASLAFALALGGVAEAAQSAEATASVNVRSGPSTNYRVLDTLHAGEAVQVPECRTNGWCYVVKAGADGWVSGHYLAFDNSPAPRRPAANPRPNVSFSFSFGRGNGFSIGTPPRGGRADLVCLVTFHNRDQVAAGRDADVVRARVVTRARAERLDGPNDRQGTFDYGTNKQTRETCRYLDRLNGR
jgi:hypothetical protein